MGSAVYEIPDRITKDEFSYLNCEIGEEVVPEEEGIARVLERIEVALADDFLQIYYNYPNTGRGDQDYIDVVALSRLVGGFVINIVHYSIDDIQEIQGPDWVLSHEPQSIRPDTVVGNAKVAIQSQYDYEPELGAPGQSPIEIRGYVALPKITSEEWLDKFGDSSESYIFKDDLMSREGLFEILSNESDEGLDDETLRHALATLKFSNSISGGQLNAAVDRDRKRDLLDFLERRLKIITDKQLKIGLQTPDAPQQIRGIAGSGKTVVCALRAAILHKKNPTWDIAVTFRTHGLRQTHEELISNFYNNITGGDEVNWDKVRVIHGWGGRSSGPGMYSVIASEADAKALSSNQARSEFGRYTSTPELLDKCCRRLHTENDIPKFFDAIIIDEAQDLTPHFFRMCYKALKPEKRVYWAYDEAQNLASLEALSAAKLFGYDKGQQRVDVSKRLSGGINATHVMRKAFRTPRPVLMTAHAFGMGLYRDGPVIQTISNQRGWENLGYEIVEGNFKRESIGEEVLFKRPIENSPHPFLDYQSPDELFTEEWADSWQEEINWVVDNISENIEEENVLPEEIIVTHLWPYEERKERLEQFKVKMEERLGALTDGGDSIVNHVTENVRKRGSQARFTENGKITLCEVHHARGNESGLVYVMGANYVSRATIQDYRDEDNWRNAHVKARNKAFVALTRTQGWCRVTGSDPDHKVVSELTRIKQDTVDTDPKIVFEVPSPDNPYKDMVTTNGT